ncbi:C-type lectin-like [Sphaerodactylus townsendi]|nr:C-type lectin-like [Sphaerodactylus townsendi]
MEGAKGKSCPRGWLSYVSSCYGLFPDKLTWKEAEKECQALGESGHLASILSDDEQNLVVPYIKDEFQGVGNVWFGLRDRWKFRYWGWVDGSEAKDFHWTANAPKLFTSSKHCAYLIESEGYKTWQDSSCSVPYAFLCKMKA